ncbi:MAG: hypothetical protein K5921_05490, partial [Lachnospiraceae bacterium]|nr:hypothetical protein [Lachnospiraceae bacterium]
MKSKLFNFLLMILISFIISGNGAYATSTTPSGSSPQNQEEEEKEEDDNDDGEDDVEDDPVEPKEGSAVIIEHRQEQNGTVQNDLKHIYHGYDSTNSGTEADLIFDNDLPKITMKETYAEADVIVDNNYTNFTTTSGQATTSSGVDTSKYEQYKIKNGADPKEVKFFKDDKEVNLEDGDKVIFDGIKDTKGNITKEEVEGEDGKKEVKFIRTTESESQNAITKAVEKALKEVDKDSRYVTIRVSEGEYDGDVNITSDMLDRVSDENKPTFLSNFTLYILNEGSYEPAASEDSFIDKDTINSGSTKKAKLNGNINIDGINVVLAGIYMSLENTIKVKNAALTVYGSKDGDNFNIERGCDKESEENYKVYDFKVDTGDGDDNVIYSESVHVDDIDISTGDGKDEVTIKCGDEVDNDRGKFASDTGRKNIINTGAGEDIVTVDIGIAQVLSDTRILQIAMDDINETVAENGYDTLVLCGTLKDEEGTPNAVRELTENGFKTYEITVYESEGNRLVLTTPADNLTDQLDGKPKYNIKKNDLVNGTYTANKAFVNYVLDDDLFDQGDIYDGDPSDDDNKISLPILRNIRFIEDPNNKPYFTKVLIEKNKFAVSNLDIGILDLEMSGKQIYLGTDKYSWDTNNATTLKAKNIVIKVEDSDSNVVEEAVNEVLGNEYVQAIPGLGDAEIGFGTFDFVTDALIHILKSAKVIAGGSIDMSASSSQTSVLKISAGEHGVQMPVTVKVGNAEIIIKGSIKAEGKVSAVSDSKVNVSADSSGLARFFVPLAVVVAITSAETDLTSTGKIESKGTTSLKSNTDVTTTCLATVGKLPISLAVSVVSVDSHVNVEGTIISQSDIELIANGKSDVTTESKEHAPKITKTTINTTNANQSSGTTVTPTGGGNTYGGFFAVAVVLQDVDASVTGNAKLDAKGDIKISSESKEKAATHADSAQGGDNSENGGSQTPDSVTGIISALLGSFTNCPAFANLTGAAGSKFTDVMGRAGKKAEGGQY